VSSSLTSGSKILAFLIKYQLCYTEPLFEAQLTRLHQLSLQRLRAGRAVRCFGQVVNSTDYQTHFIKKHAWIAQLVRLHQLSLQRLRAGRAVRCFGQVVNSTDYQTHFIKKHAWIAQLVEHPLGKGKVVDSSSTPGST
jgi:hypothetical protein